jgi:drug/metabolite transporter (DMT)-like permease
MEISRKDLLTYTIGGLLFSFAGIFFKPLTGIFHPLEIAGWRSVVVALTFLALRPIAGKSIYRLPLSFSRWQWFSAFALAVQTICFSIAIILSSTADTFLVCNAAPVYMVFWQAVFDRRLPTRVEAFIVGGAMIGLVLFFAESLSKTSNEGFFASIIAGLAFAGHIYAQGRVGSEGLKNGEQLTLGSVLLGSLLTICLAFPLSLIFAGAHTSPVSIGAIGLLVCLGVFQFALPMMLWARSLPFIPPLIAAFMPTLIAIWAPCWTYLLLSEAFPGALTLLGAVIVHAAVLFAAFRRVRIPETAST